MSERDEQRKFAQEEVYQELIEQSDSRDAGLALFDAQILEVQEALRKSHLGTQGSYFEALQHATDDLNESWSYHEDVAVVTGRVYLAEAAFEDYIPEEWGEFQRDEDGEPYFYLEDVRLRSHGVEVLPEFDNEDGMTIGIKIGYVFSIESDDEQTPLFVGYPGELFRHEYSIPTPAEAEVRLRKHWPDQLKLIDLLTTPDLQSALPHRMTMLSRRLQHELSSSSVFAALAEIYINDRLALNTQLPYIVTVEGAMSYYDGSDPFDAEDNGEWMDLETKESLTIIMFSPSVHFYDSADQQQGAYILGLTFNSEDGEDPEYVSAHTEAILSFQSTLAMRSLATRALLGIGSDEDHSIQLPDASERNSEGVLKIEKGPVPRSLDKEQNEPLFVRELMMLEKEFKNIMKEVQHAQETVYSTADFAMDACRDLIKTSIESQLTGAGIYQGHIFVISGALVQRPQVNKNLSAPEHPSHTFTYGLDPQNPNQLLDEHDEMPGTFYSFEPYYKEILDEDGTVSGYAVAPAMMTNLAHYTTSLLTVQTTSMAEITLQTRAFVPLDGTSNIKLAELEQYKAGVSALAQVGEDFSDEPILKDFKRLNRALFNEEIKEFQNLKNIRMLTRIGSEIETMKESNQDVSVLASALESMFVKRRLMVRGDMYSWNNGEILADNQSENSNLIDGVVIDVRTDSVGNTPVLVVQSIRDDRGIKHIPLTSITGLQF